MEQSSCYSYFLFRSAGELQNISATEKGYIFQEFKAFENSFFDPADITAILGIEPKKAFKMGSPIQNSKKLHPFSLWTGCEQTQPEMDAEQQVLNIIRTLKPLIPKILEIKQKYHIDTEISIVPYIYHEDAPVVYFNQEIIEFCLSYKNGNPRGYLCF